MTRKHKGRRDTAAESWFSDFDTAEPLTEAIAHTPEQRGWGGASAPGLDDGALAAIYGLPRPALPHPPRRHRPDTAMFARTPYGWVLLCGMCQWRRHADPAAEHQRQGFRALRASARHAGWVLDAFGRWCCPPCAATPAYRALYPVAHWHPHAARAAADPRYAERVRAWYDRDLPADLLLAASAEQAVLENVNGSALRGKHHRAGAA